MSRRAVWILFAFAVGLSTYVYFFEGSAVDWEGRGRVFRELEPSHIVEMELVRPRAARDVLAGVDPRPVRLRREGPEGTWWIVEPIRFPAFHPRTQAMAYAVADLALIAQAQGNVVAFKEGPELVLKVRTRFGDEHGIEVGSEHPDPKFQLAYCRVRGEVFVTSPEFRKTIDASLTELRSRALLGIAPPDAVALVVEGDPKVEKTLERDSSSPSWRLRKPLDAAADRDLVETLLRDLNSWAIESFLSDEAREPEALRPYGLDAPRAAVTLRHRGGASITVEIGSDVPGASPPHVHVRHAGEPHVFSAAAELVGRLLDGADGLRARHVFDLGFEDVVEVTASFADWAAATTAEPMTLRKRPVPRRAEAAAPAAKDKPAPMEWEVTAAGGEAFPGDAQIIEAQIVALRKLLIHKFLSEPIESPRGRLVLRTAEGRSSESLLGPRSEAVEDKGYNMYPVHVPGEPGAYLVSTLLPVLIVQGPHAFRKRNISDFEPEQIIELTVFDGADSWSLARVPGEAWMLDVETPLAEGKALSSAAVNQLLHLLRAERFRVVGYLPELRDFARHGLELHAPRRGLELTRFHAGSASFRKLLLGDPVEGSKPAAVRARVDTAGLPPFTVEEDVHRLFGVLVRHLREITGNVGSSPGDSGTAAPKPEE